VVPVRVMRRVIVGLFVLILVGLVLGVQSG
jgi:hypothetical protein